MNRMEIAVALARDIVAAHRMPWEFYGFDIGGSDSSGSTRFTRTGTSESEKQFTLPSDLAALIKQAYTGSQVPDATVSQEQQLLQTLLSQNTASLPGLSTLQAIMSIDPSIFQGMTSLANMTARNPYSSDYETGVGAVYDRQFAKGRSLAQSGPMNVRGGTARQGFELGEADAQQGMNKFREVRGQQDREAGVVQEAVKTMSTIEAMRRGSQMQAQGLNMSGELGRKSSAMGAAGGVNDIRRSNSGNMALAGEMLGRPKQTTTDNLKGRGSQSASSSNWGAGLSCCFIFNQALNGQLPSYVRRGRDEFNTPNRRSGYVWMSTWLCPAMAQSALAASMVNWILILPFLIVGKWHYHREHSLLGPVLKPYCWAWFWLWSAIGWVYGKSLRHHLFATV